MLYTLQVFSAVCQLHLKRLGRSKREETRKLVCTACPPREDMGSWCLQTRKTPSSDTESAGTVTSAVQLPEPWEVRMFCATAVPAD